MNNVLVTGASSFLGYHVAKRLNQQGIRPRVIDLPGIDTSPLAGLQVERAGGVLGDRGAAEGACEGVDTLFHMAYKVSIGGDAAAINEMRDINVEGTKRLLDAAAAKGATRAVVTGSALAVGVNRNPQPLDESADPVKHVFSLPYAAIRRLAEQESLACTRPGFDVVSIAPSFTFGPDDPVGAPANKLVKSLIDRKLFFTLPVGFGCLDVRDFAAGAVLAAERGAAGRRYLLSGENVTTDQLLAQAAEIAGVKAPRLKPPLPLLKLVVAVVEGVSALRHKSPPITRSVLQIVNRYAWYDATLARTELGWSPRPLRQTLEDTIHWLREHEAAAGEKRSAAVL